MLEYCLLSEAGEIETKYYCELCECDSDVDRMVEHLAGFGHRKNYLVSIVNFFSSDKYSSRLFLLAPWTLNRESLTITLFNGGAWDPHSNDHGPSGCAPTNQTSIINYSVDR